jgi:type II secretory pathway component HofQ
MKLSAAARFLATSVGMIVVGFVAGSVAAAPPAPAAARSKSNSTVAARKGITSFNFNNIPVRSALQLIAEEGHFNLVVSDSVQGNISLRLNDVTWEQALDLVLRIKGLQQHVDRNTRSVAPAGG